MKYLLIPIVKNPYARIGPEQWQDWYRQIVKTISIAGEHKQRGDEVVIVILSQFRATGKPSEIDVYSAVFRRLAPELTILSYSETHCTAEQVERSFSLSKEMGAELIFFSAWMQYLRVLYLARGRTAQHYSVFGIPQPVFAIIDPLCIFLEPLAHMLGVASFFQRIIVRQREKGRIL